MRHFHSWVVIFGIHQTSFSQLHHSAQKGSQKDQPQMRSTQKGFLLLACYPQHLSKITGLQMWLLEQNTGCQSKSLSEPYKAICQVKQVHSYTNNFKQIQPNSLPRCPRCFDVTVLLLHLTVFFSFVPSSCKLLNYPFVALVNITQFISSSVHPQCVYPLNAASW